MNSKIDYVTDFAKIMHTTLARTTTEKNEIGEKPSKISNSNT